MTTPFERAADKFYRDLAGMKSETTPLYCWAFSNPDWIEGDVYLPNDICARIRGFLPQTSYRQLKVIGTPGDGGFTRYRFNESTTIITGDSKLGIFKILGAKSIGLFFDLVGDSETLTLFQGVYSNGMSSVKNVVNGPRTAIVVEYRSHRIVLTINNGGFKSTPDEITVEGQTFQMPASKFNSFINDNMMAEIADSIGPMLSTVTVNEAPIPRSVPPTPRGMPTGPTGAKAFSVRIQSTTATGAAVTCTCTVVKDFSVTSLQMQASGNIADSDRLTRALMILFTDAY